MSVSTVSNVSQAMASYAAQLQAVRPRESFPEADPGRRDPTQDASAVDLVTLNSLQPRSEANLLAESGRTDFPRAGAAQQSTQQSAVPAPAPTNAADQAMTSKSITRALEAYVQASLV